VLAQRKMANKVVIGCALPYEPKSGGGLYEKYKNNRSGCLYFSHATQT
jgi:hypothetical protein